MARTATAGAWPRTNPVLRLAECLSVPLRERNALLAAAGFAPVYPQRPLDDPGLEAARRAVTLILKGHAPHPALAVDRHWTLAAANRTVAPLLAGAHEGLLQPPVTSRARDVGSSVPISVEGDASVWNKVDVTIAEFLGADMDVVVPDMGEHTAEVVVKKWRVAPGERVEPGAELAEVESWKAAVIIEAESAGTVAEIRVEAGATVAVGSVICRIDPGRAATDFREEAPAG